MEEYEASQEQYELRKQAWKEQFKQSHKKGELGPVRPNDKPQKPALRRLIVNETTFQALHQIMSENPAGLVVIRDELTGWWSQLDQEGHEADRAFHLQCWNGDTSFTIDTITRGTIYVPACCTSMIGGIQPARLRSYLAAALADGPTNDGLVQRFQLLVWPDFTPDWEYVDRPPDAELLQRVEDVFRTLIDMDAESPTHFRFADDGAQELFVEWISELEAKIRGTEHHPALVSHLSKYRSLMPSIALLLALADAAAGGRNPGKVIELCHAQRAAAWCAYLESHARRVYSCIVSPQLRAAQVLAENIKAKKIGADGFFTSREVVRKGWTDLGSLELIKQAVELLHDANWVLELICQSPRGGRSSIQYQINPKLYHDASK